MKKAQAKTPTGDRIPDALPKKYFTLIEGELTKEQGRLIAVAIENRSERTPPRTQAAPIQIAGRYPDPPRLTREQKRQILRTLPASAGKTAKETALARIEFEVEQFVVARGLPIRKQPMQKQVNAALRTIIQFAPDDPVNLKKAIGKLTIETQNRLLAQFITEQKRRKWPFYMTIQEMERLPAGSQSRRELAKMLGAAAQRLIVQSRTPDRSLRIFVGQLVEILRDVTGKLPGRCYDWYRTDKEQCHPFFVACLDATHRLPIADCPYCNARHSRYPTMLIRKAEELRRRVGKNS